MLRVVMTYNSCQSCLRAMGICHLNIRRLVSKFDELQVIIEGCKGLVLGISETWLN